VTAWLRWLPLRLLISPLVLVLLWQAVSMAGVLPARILAPPSQILATGWSLLASGELTWHLAVSLARVAAGLAIGVSIGAGLALIAGLSRLGEAVVDAPVQMLRTLPFLALVPLFILWFGIGETPKVALVALGTAFPIYLNLFAGIGAWSRGWRRWAACSAWTAPAWCATSCCPARCRPPS